MSDTAPDGGPNAESLTLRAGRLLQNWRDAHRRARTYARSLGLDDAASAAGADTATTKAATAPARDKPFDALRESLANLREIMQRSHPPSGDATFASDGFPDWRLRVAVEGLKGDGSTRSGSLWRGRGPAYAPLRRRSMRPHQYVKRRGRPTITADRPPHPDGIAPGEDGMPDGRRLGIQRRSQPWWPVSLRRRLVLGILILLPSLIAVNFMIDVLPHQGRTWLELGIALVFAALFGWISIGFWTALLGFLILLVRRDRFAVTQSDADSVGDLDPGLRVAIIMPICEEPVDRVFAGLRAIDTSLAKCPEARHFDFFILSDSADPSRWVQEEEAWFDWCRDVGGFGRIFYRRRRVRLERKSGNVADFCRRWGDGYRYMIVLDADSVMAGETLVRLVRMMEAKPRAAIIQTVPYAVGRRSLFARAQQFASRVYGPMFSAGLHFWQLGDGQYWGHNAIIRVSPFIEHCSLPRLPGGPPLGGEILSHDFVEAALLGRAGWELWLAYDLPGSWEDTSSSLLEEMQRDRRWCQGNLQHLRLLRTRGLIGAHRALFLNGVLSYVSAALWFIFLALSTTEAIWEAVRPVNYFPSGMSLFPEWPVWRPNWALSLAAVTAAILFLPKLLSIALVMVRGPGARAFGGVVRLLVSVVFEIVLSSLLAPIRMVFHTRFVVTNLLGHTVTWRSSSRGDSETGWAQAIRYHGLDTLLGAGWGLGVYWLNPGYFWWLTPIVAALMLSVPTSVLASRIHLGDRVRRLGLLRIPEELDPPVELVDTEQKVQLARQLREQIPEHERDGFVRAVVDPYINAIHCSLLGPPRRLRDDVVQRRRALIERALEKGPASLDRRERVSLLYDPQALTDLHRAVWAEADPFRALRWGRPGTAETGTRDAGAPAQPTRV